MTHTGTGRAELGAQLWAELHHYAFGYPAQATAADARAAREWLAAWSRRIPQYGCSCRAEWHRIERRCPPALSTRADFYWWTVAAHDYINHQLGKPLAAAAWSLAHPIFTSP